MPALAPSLPADLYGSDDVDTSYEPFSREPEYIEANRQFVANLGVRPGMQVLDIACGTATMTDLLFEMAGGPQAPLKVVGLDLSRESLLFGQQYLRGRAVYRPLTDWDQNTAAVYLLEGTAERLPLADASVDLALMGNAIQLVGNLDAMVAEIARVLRPGGRFGFNTSFYSGTYCPGTEHVYIRWVQEALGYIMRRDAQLRAAGQPGIPRQRGKAARAFSKPWLSADDYAQALQARGFKVERRFERTVPLTQSSFEKIGAYAGLAKVLLSGYPVKLASEALEWAAGPTLEAVGMVEVPRFWLEMNGVRAG